MDDPLFPTLIPHKASPIEGADILVIPRYWPMSKEVWSDVAASFRSLLDSLHKVEKRGLHVDQRVLKVIEDCEQAAEKIVKGQR
jgi:hypothetical protein